jgi:hypothetical protein
MKRKYRSEVVEAAKKRTAESVKGDARAGQVKRFEAERRLERSPP